MNTRNCQDRRARLKAGGKIAHQAPSQEWKYTSGALLVLGPRAFNHHGPAGTRYVSGAGQKRLEFRPLHFAAEAGHDAVAALLLKHGADAEAPDGDGNMPLAYAARGGHARVVDALLAAGARPSTRAGTAASHNPLRKSANCQ